MFDCPHNSCGNGQEQGNVQNQGQQSRKDREELVDDLVNCLAQLEDDSDLDQIDRILEEIDQIEPVAPDFDAEKSLAGFYQKYGYLFSANPPVEQNQKPKCRRTLLHIARTAAIIAALLVACIGVAQASGFNILSIFPWWNEERFHFVQEETDMPKVVDSNPDLEFESLQAALDAYRVQTPMAPSQLPEGAKLETLVVSDNIDQLTFRAQYTLPDGELYITIRQTTETPFSDIEKNADETEIYVVNEIEHHIMDDVDTQKAIWYNGIWEGYITGDVSREEVVAMIDSIYQ